MIVLAGDLGGTKINLAVFEWRQDDLIDLRAKSYRSDDYDGLGPALEDFLASGSVRPQAAAFGVAGPVKNGRARITNLPWTVDRDELRAQLGTEVAVINDLEATAYGVLTLGSASFLVLNEGRKIDGTAAVIAAGTGLGEAVLFWNGEEHLPAPSEGGHTDFGPRNRLETDLLEYLRSRLERVSYERVVSGAGLVHVYEFLRDSGRGRETKGVQKRMRQGDPAAVISEFALNDADPLCVRALHVFVSIYGAEAGNLALKTLATGGIYVGGGIAPKIRAKLADGTFMEAFCDKGRMQQLMRDIPVRVVLEDKAALRGAALCALRLGRKSGWRTPSAGPNSGR